MGRVFSFGEMFAGIASACMIMFTGRAGAG
jgi:hypothetical protein